jgi:5-methylthioadenosine/S-adenosylhomocysteine deaminase
MATMQKGFVVIRGGRLADTVTRRGEPAEILIEDGIIRAVATKVEAPAEAMAVDATGMLLHPGLINAHTHGHTGLAKGQLDTVTLELLLAAAPWIGGSRSLEDKKLSTLICAAEMVAKGCTAAYDLHTNSRCRRWRAWAARRRPMPRPACAPSSRPWSPTAPSMRQSPG